jgi:hypothetical protein
MTTWPQRLVWWCGGVAGVGKVVERVASVVGDSWDRVGGWKTKGSMDKTSQKLH